MDPLDDIVVYAKPWTHGWELHIKDHGVTQTEKLEEADSMVREYLELLLDKDLSNCRIEIIVSDS